LPLVLPRSTLWGSDAPLCGGLLSLQAAVTPPLLEPPVLLGLLLLLEPHAVRLSAAATPRIPIEAEVLRIRPRLSSPAVRRGGRRTGLCFVREHIARKGALARDLHEIVTSASAPASGQVDVLSVDGR
jgi:hypothetical protein